MLDRRCLAALLLAAATLAPACAAPAASAAAAGRTIAIEDMQYAAATLSVHRGERVTWVNKDLVPHTVTARDKSFDSGSIAPGASWSTVLPRAGRVAYGCSFHPTMTAVLVVE